MYEVQIYIFQFIKFREIFMKEASLGLSSFFFFIPLAQFVTANGSVQPDFPLFQSEASGEHFQFSLLVPIRTSHSANN